MDQLLTPNQIVAHNLARLRRQRGMTQQQTVESLAPYLRSPWSVASLSAAERSVDGKRIKEFDADELVALSRVFRVPLSFWLLPAAGEEVGVSVPDRDQGLTDSETHEVVFGEAGELPGPSSQEVNLARRLVGQLDETLARLGHRNLSVSAVTGRDARQPIDIDRQ